MALSQQQTEHQERLASPTQREGAVRSFWREVVTENPIYLREVRGLVLPAGYSPEKTEQLREKLRTQRAAWEALSPLQKLGKTTLPYVILFACTYALIPAVLPYLRDGGGGGMVGPLIGSLFLSGATSAATIVSERERRTWNALLLTRLTPAQLIGGKLALVLRNLLLGNAALFSMALAAVLHGLLPPGVLLLFLLVLAPSALLTALVGIRISLWSKSLKDASQKALWQGALLNLLALVVGVAGVLALLGKAPLALCLLPLLYFVLALGMSLRLWRRLLQELWQAPKDFSG